MTVAKSLQRKDVEKVVAALERALSAECPMAAPPHAYNDPSTTPRPKSKRARALFEAYRLAWSALMRFKRREQKEQAKMRGRGEQFYDDQLVDRAIESLHRARAATRNAADFLAAHIEAGTQEAERLGVGNLLQQTFVKKALKGARSRIDYVDSIQRDLEALLDVLTTFHGIPQARTRGDWDRFVSSSAAKLLDAGFGPREVAGLLTGRPAEQVDRATLERFRQRVRRLEISAD
jgi:hypothetical protein